MSVVSLFLMLHHAYGQYYVNTVPETGSCCSVSPKNDDCCKKTSSSKTIPCKVKSCCSYTVSAPAAILEPGLDLTVVKHRFLQQKIGNGEQHCVLAPLYSIWQPPKIRLNL